MPSSITNHADVLLCIFHWNEQEMHQSTKMLFYSPHSHQWDSHSECLKQIVPSWCLWCLVLPLHIDTESYQLYCFGSQCEHKCNKLVTFSVPSSLRLIMSKSKSFLNPSVLLKVIRPVKPSQRAQRWRMWNKKIIQFYCLASTFKTHQNNSFIIFLLYYNHF